MPNKKTFKEKVYDKLNLAYGPHLRLYKGFGNKRHFFICGHALLLSYNGRKSFRQRWWVNTLSLFRMFMAKALPGVEIMLEWNGCTYSAVAGADGFFVFDIPLTGSVEPGIYEVTATLPNTARQYKATNVIHIAGINQYTFISDIDDTFLVSHSATIFKRIKLLLSSNPASRKPFEGVVKHYQALEMAHTTTDNPNSFFYVSSSEWNLYSYIAKFIALQQLPQGVLLLNQIKTLSQVFNTGKNNHNTKFTRIVRILELYPTQRFVLLGDDSQRDAYIYASLAEHFPTLIHCVYIRCTTGVLKPQIEQELGKITALNIPACYFKHSTEAMAHSASIGLINI